jgi:myo-inositol-1(or 4)-monophosphatase
MGTPDAIDLVAIAVDAARAAGELLLGRFRGPAAGVGSKASATDMVSEADRSSEALIRERLRAARPQDGIIGEEHGVEEGSSELRWVVDPLDGTTNYLFGIPQWCVSIACEDDAGGIAGVVLDPVRDEVFTAARGIGAFLGERRLRISSKTDIADALIATGFSYLPSERAVQAERLTRVLPRVRDIRRAGSAALDLAWTAAARFDAFYEVPTHHWDRAAGELLVREAGGLTSELDAIGPSGPGLVAAGEGLHDALRALVLGRG